MLKSKLTSKRLANLPGYFSAASVILLASFNLSFGASPANEEAVTRWVAVLKSDAAEKEKADACRELARVGTAEAAAPLARLLGDEHLEAVARQALESIPGPAASEALRQTLERLQGKALAGAIASLGARHDEQSVSALAGMVRHPDAEVAQAAARALGEIGGSSAGAALQVALRECSEKCRLAIAEGLLRCAEKQALAGRKKEAQALYESLRGLDTPFHIRAAATRGAALSGGRKGVPLLIAALDTSDLAHFGALLPATYEIPGSEMTGALAELLGKCSEDKQVPLIQTLGRRHDMAAMATLIKVTKGSAKAARLAAIQALVEIGNPVALKPALAMLESADGELRQAAQAALGALPGKEADAVVLKMLRSRVPEREATGIELTARRRILSAMPDLLELAARGEVATKTRALKGLGEIAGGEELPALLELLRNAKSPEEMESVEQTLSAACVRAGESATVTRALIAQMEPGSTVLKCALLRILGSASGAMALKAVRFAVDSPEPEVHGTALRVLCNWNTPDAAPELLALARTREGTDRVLSLSSYLRFADQLDLPAEQRVSMCREGSKLVQSVAEKNLLLAALGDIFLMEFGDLAHALFG